MGSVEGALSISCLGGGNSHIRECLFMPRLTRWVACLWMFGALLLAQEDMKAFAFVPLQGVVVSGILLIKFLYLLNLLKHEFYCPYRYAQDGHNCAAETPFSQK